MGCHCPLTLQVLLMDVVHLNVQRRAELDNELIITLSGLQVSPKGVQ